MTFLNFVRLTLLALLPLWTSGCGTYAAHLLACAPNRYPTWFDYAAPVTLGFNPILLTNFTNQYVEVGPPSAKLCYRIIEPADYDLIVTSTNWLKDNRREYQFNFHAKVPGPPNQWTAAPRGTVILLHGYGLAQFSMMPWALRLGQEGWRCVLLDLRGHGHSTGKQIYFGERETHDLTQLLDALAQNHQLKEPVEVVGESYGAALALRWKGVEPRVQAVVSIAPYASLSNAVLNIRHDYAPWVPSAFVRAGLKQLPRVLDLPASEFDTTTILQRRPVSALFVAGADDSIAPVAEVKKLDAMAAPGSQMIVVPEATHESLTYFFSDLDGPIQAWLTNAIPLDRSRQN